MRNQSTRQAAHPGSHVRTKVIPAGMSVKDAAKALGIGRPALSNFLNGKAALSTEMAARLERAFGADMRQLLAIQAEYDNQEQRANIREVAVRSFVPSFLTIKAFQINRWADQIGARELLPVLLRKLVHSAGTEFRYVDFPGYDNSQRTGPDGLVDAGAATPWIPEGRSFWEFGTSQDPKAKAERDYIARSASVAPDERERSTWVFVTPRNWPGKVEFAKLKNASGDWKAVRALDASDLEQWLEQSIPAQVWFAEQMLLNADGCETLDGAWHKWSSASEPALLPQIFAPAVATYRDQLRMWLDKPSERPFIVAADSAGEALAFLACVFDDEALRKYSDRAAIFTAPETLRKLMASSVPFVPIVQSPQAERELLDAHRRIHCIVVHSRNAVDAEPDIALSQLSSSAFHAALSSMGLDADKIDRLAIESGRSPTVLRRRLSGNTAIRTPAWAGDDDKAKSLIPMVMIGAWDTGTQADCEILSQVAACKYEAVEDAIARLLQLDDSPVWSTGQFRGVVSKIDALYAIARMVTTAELDRFLGAAEIVLSEVDPALVLPEEQRWAAAIYKKTREHSSALRAGVCDSLVLLSVHGNILFRERLGINVEDKVTQLIRKLLVPLTLEKLQSCNHELPRYAEAAPVEFLRIVQDDLQQPTPIVTELIKPSRRSPLFGSPIRTGLLWSLECLAWNPQLLPRVATILTELSQYEIDDNWANKPEASLQGIFRSWMPQTAATVEQRIKVLQALSRRYPKVAWQIALKQIEWRSQYGHRSYLPRWRSDASGAGQVVSAEERDAFVRFALDHLITWPGHDEATIGDLVEAIRGMAPAEQERTWDLVHAWSRQVTDDNAKAVLRERIRRFAFTRRGRHRMIGEEVLISAREAYDALRPGDPVIRHSWLFADHWVPESEDEIDEDDLDYSKRSKRVTRMRREAMSEILGERGLTGVGELLARSRAADVVGDSAAACICQLARQIEFVRYCLSLAGELREKGDWCLRGYLGAVESDARITLIRAAIEELPDAEHARLVICAPFVEATWRLLDCLGDGLRDSYWKNVLPSWGLHTPAELAELIDQLLSAGRPRAAFHAAHLEMKNIETSQLRRLMFDVATVAAESTDTYRIESYQVSEALDQLDGKDEVSREEMAQLEFLFIGAADDSRHGIPNLENQIAESPAAFAQAVAWVYKRSDGGEDPAEMRVTDPKQSIGLADASHHLLELIRKTPGTGQNGQVDYSMLAMWLSETRRLCREYARADVGDQCIGQLLARAPVGASGEWPCDAVCRALEDVASPQIGKGFHIGVFNSRGVHVRGEGGKQERDLAARYRACAERIRFDHPYVGDLFDGIAAAYERDAHREDTEATVVRRLHV